MKIKTAVIVGLCATTIISACVDTFEESCGTNGYTCPDDSTGGTITCSWQNKKNSNREITSGTGYNSVKSQSTDCIEKCSRNVAGTTVQCGSRTNSVSGSIPNPNSGSCSGGTGTH